VEKRPLVASLVGLLLVVAVAGAYLGTGARPHLGLDLQGGISAIYTPSLDDDEPVPDDFEEIVDETIEVIRARVDSLGVAEPDISRQGTDVLVQLPGVDDPDRLQELIGTDGAHGPSARSRRSSLPARRPTTRGRTAPLPVDEQEELDDDEAGILCGSAPTTPPSPTPTTGDRPATHEVPRERHPARRGADRGRLRPA
jgi:preprotein translocase subunit SecD